MRQLEPLAVDAREAAALLGLSRSMFYKMMEAGRIGPQGRRFGKAVRFSVAELRAWAAAGMPPRHVWQSRKPSS
jgi:excisionase family DNA binding protein